MNHTFAPSGRSLGLCQRIAGVLIGLCLLPAVSWAADDKAPPSGRSAGTRGCGSLTRPAQSQVPALILLAPNQQPGKTGASRPTFAWFVRDAKSLPMEFRLYEQTADGFQLVQEVKGDRLKSTPGIMVLPPDPTMPELAPGKRYRWQVELICDPDNPSGNLFAESELQVVAIQPQLRSQLRQQHDRAKQAQLYAQANLWYDSLSVAFSPLNNHTDLKDWQLSLLNKVAINPSEQSLLQNSRVHWLTP